MPRLDGGGGGVSSGARAYPQQGVAVLRILTYISLFMLMRHAFTTDYREEQISHLRTTGKMTDSEIEKYVPKTEVELNAARRKKMKDSTLLIEEVELLQKQVRELRLLAGLEDSGAAATKNGNTSMGEAVPGKTPSLELEGGAKGATKTNGSSSIVGASSSAGKAEPSASEGDEPPFSKGGEEALS